MLVGGWHGGAKDWFRAVGAMGQEKSLSDLADTGALTRAGAPSLPEGRHMYLSPNPLHVSG